MVEKLKLCYIGDAQSIHLKRWASEFSNRGYEVHIISDFSMDELEGITFHKIEKKGGFLGNRNAAKQVRQTIQKIKPSIVHAHIVFAYGYYGVKACHHPLIVSPWGSDISTIPENSSVVRRITKNVLKEADYIHCGDTHMEERVNELVGNTGNVIINGWGIDPDVFKPQERANDGTVKVLFLRKSQSPYNLDTLLNAIPWIVKQNPNVKFIILKSGTEIDTTIKKIKKMKMEQNVHYIDPVPYGKMPALLNSCDIYLDTYYSEVPGSGIGLTAFEAMSCQVPIVAPNTSGIEYYVKNKENGMIYKGKDSESLSQAIIELVNKPELRKTIGKNAREYVLKEQNWKLNMDKMDSFYRSIVKGGSA